MSFKKRIYRAAVSQRLRNNGLEYNSLLVALGGWGLRGDERNFVSKAED